MIYTLTFKGNPPLIPTIQIPCYRATMEQGMVEKLLDVVATERPHILETTPPPPGGGTFLSGRFQHYNLLSYNHEALRHLESFIKKHYLEYMTAIDHPIEPAYIRMWANSYSFNTRLVWHNHFESLFGIEGAVWSHISANICLRAKDTKTWYLSPFLGGVGHDSFGEGYEYPSDVLGIENVIGECFFFPSWLVHKPDYNPNQENRITLAFDILPESVWSRKKENRLFKLL